MSRKIQAIETQLATHEIFGQVRFIQYEDDDQIYFVAKDVCTILGIRKYRDAVARLDEDEKGCPVIVDTLGGLQEMTTVNESGLYHLIFMSRKPAAKKFRKWVTSEVLPSIRKFGYYSLEDDRRNWTGDQWLEYYQDLKKKLPYMTNEEKLALAEDPDILVWQRMNGEVKVQICF